MSYSGHAQTAFIQQISSPDTAFIVLCKRTEEVTCRLSVARTNTISELLLTLIELCAFGINRYSGTLGELLHRLHVTEIIRTANKRYDVAARAAAEAVKGIGLLIQYA